MGNGIEEKWIEGAGVARRLRLKNFEIFDLLASGKLQPYSPITGHKIKWYDFNRMDHLIAYDKREFFDKYLFLKTDIDAIDTSHAAPARGDQGPLSAPDPPTPAPPVPVKNSAVNFLAREGDSWHIGFEGKETRVNHLTGLQYIGYLLDPFLKSRKPISCRELYQAASGKTPDKTMSEGAAIGEGLNIGGSKQAKSDPKIKAQYISEYMELENDLLEINDLPYEDRTPEDEMQKKEIEEKMAKIMPYLKDKNFADPNDIKAQSNIRKRLDTAYKAIGKKKGMEGMEKHLRANIESNGHFGLSYTGDLPWEITQ